MITRIDPWQKQGKKLAFQHIMIKIENRFCK